MKLHHPHLYDNVRAIEKLDVEKDWLRIYQLTALYDLPQDTLIGLQCAFYRTFAVPRIAEVIHRSGEMHRNSRKRAYDTALVVYEIIAGGFDSPRGREMVRMLNRVHRGWGIVPEDFRYVLCCFIVTPVRWIERNGWRTMTSNELDAANRFYVELGRRMNISDLPASFADADAAVRDYEERNFRWNVPGESLIASSIPVMIERLPGILKRDPRAAAAVILSEPSLLEALRLRPPPSRTAWTVRALLAIRNSRRRLSRPATSPWFVPGQTVRYYPNGYALSDLGPPSAPADARSIDS